VNYVSNADAASILAESLQQLYGVKACIIRGACYLIMPPEIIANNLQDIGVAVDNTRLVNETVEKLGGLDIIVANAGWTRMTKIGDIYALSYEEWNKVCKIFVFKLYTELRSAGQ
jgi:NAD(P)-dependent dehydrogenase (short-subunit alcohol dehydrogenase family)